MLNANITDEATRTRVNVTLGRGKAVHAGTALSVKGEHNAAAPDCGGGRATGDYLVTDQDVTCKRCLKALDARDWVLAEGKAVRAEMLAEAYAERDEQARVVARARALSDHAARLSDKTRAAAALRGLVGQVVSAVEEAVTETASRSDTTRNFWSGDVFWSAESDGRTWTAKEHGTWTLGAARDGWYLSGPGTPGLWVGPLRADAARKAEELIRMTTGH